MLDKGVGTSNVATLDLRGDALLKLRAESDIHWPRVLLQSLSILDSTPPAAGCHGVYQMPPPPTSHAVKSQYPDLLCH